MSLRRILRWPGKCVLTRFLKQTRPHGWGGTGGEGKRFTRKRRAHFGDIWSFQDPPSGSLVQASSLETLFGCQDSSRLFGPAFSSRAIRQARISESGADGGL